MFAHENSAVQKEKPTKIGQKSDFTGTGKIMDKLTCNRENLEIFMSRNFKLPGLFVQFVLILFVILVYNSCVTFLSLLPICL